MSNNLIMKYVTLKGYSHIFPFGCRVLVNKKEKDKKGKEFYHAIFFAKNNVSIEVAFDIETLECTKSKYGIKLSENPEYCV